MTCLSSSINLHTIARQVTCRYRITDNTVSVLSENEASISCWTGNMSVVLKAITINTMNLIIGFLNFSMDGGLKLLTYHIYEAET